MKNIIAATDFSSSATNAVHYAAQMAKDLGAGLILFNAYTLPINYSDGVLIVPVEELKLSSEHSLELLKSEVAGLTGNSIPVSTLSRMGEVTEELKDLCKGHQPLAIMVGTQGHSRLEKVLFGSTALSIVKHLEYPVVCVPPGATYGKGIVNIGLACDFDEVAITVPAYAIRDFVNLFKTRLHIVNVNRNEQQAQHIVPEDSFAMHQMFFANKPQYHYILHKDLDDGLSQFVQDKKLDMLITIPKHHNFFSRIFRRSKTKDLINDMPIPLVCISGGLV